MPAIFPHAVLEPAAEYYGNGLAGVETMPRFAIDPAQAVATFGGFVEYCYFTPPQAVTVSSLLIATSTSGGAGATPTVCRLGLYTVAANGDLTLVARTANDTTLFANGGTLYTRALDTTGGFPASYPLAAGQRYALAFICVSGATKPGILGNGNPIFPTALVSLAPLLTRTSSEADLPLSKTAASLSVDFRLYWMGAV